jgi:hypothetical protein
LCLGGKDFSYLSTRLTTKKIGHADLKTCRADLRQAAVGKRFSPSTDASRANAPSYCYGANRIYSLTTPVSIAATNSLTSAIILAARWWIA